MRIELRGNSSLDTRRLDQPQDRVGLDPLQTLVEVRHNPIIDKLYNTLIFQSFSNLSFRKFWNFFANTDTSTRNLFLNLGFVSTINSSLSISKIHV